MYSALVSTLLYITKLNARKDFQKGARAITYSIAEWYQL